MTCIRFLSYIFLNYQVYVLLHWLSGTYGHIWVCRRVFETWNHQRRFVEIWTCFLNSKLGRERAILFAIKVPKNTYIHIHAHTCIYMHIHYHTYTYNMIYAWYRHIDTDTVLYVYVSVCICIIYGCICMYWMYCMYDMYLYVCVCMVCIGMYSMYGMYVYTLVCICCICMYRKCMILNIHTYTYNTDTYRHMHFGVYICT